MPEDHPSLTDRNGRPLGPDCFVRVDGPGLTPRHPNVFRGLVLRVSSDARGPFVVIREWKGGDFLPGERIARPEHCRVRTASRCPKQFRERQQDYARRTVGTARKARKA